MSEKSSFAHEEQPFLPLHSSPSQSSIETYNVDNTTRRSRQPSYCSIACHLILITLYTLGSILYVRHHTTSSTPLSNASPASDDTIIAGLSVTHELRRYDKFNESPFAGPPSDATDDAWHTLMNNMSIRVTAEELAVRNQTSVELPGGGQLAWLGVFHELHCVKMLRQWSWREHYYPNMTAHDVAHQMVHIDHCIDWLRNAAMCHADTSALAVFKWDDRYERPMLNTKRVVHRCVNWEGLVGSQEGRMVGHEEVRGLKNPGFVGGGKEGAEGGIHA